LQVHHFEHRSWRLAHERRNLKHLCSNP
jgi:hypothetical protein